MNGQTENNVLNSDPATEPIDLAQAFKMFNKANSGSTDPDVEPNGSGGDSDPAPDVSDVTEGQQVSSEEARDEAGSTDEQGDTDGVGGSTNVIEPVDFNARKQEILKELQQNAIQSVRQSFAENKISPCTIEELYSRDENTGRVSFKNPDDPTRDFNSRAEAQQWVDAFNKQVEMRFRQEVNKKQQELLKGAMPTIRLIDFAPKFEALDQVTKDVLDDLIEPYSITDNQGNVIGFDVDLDAALARAKKIAKRFNVPNVSADENQSIESGTGSDQGKQNRPAMKMKTGGKGAIEKEEPESIQEAMRMYNKQQRNKKKGQQ